MLRSSLSISIAAAVAAQVSAQQTIRVPQDQPTIEAAIAAAVDGDRIQLTQSNYTIGAAGLLLAKSVVIETVGNARAIISYPDNGPGTGSNTTPAFPALTIAGFGNGARIALRNLTFEGGFSHWGNSLPRLAVIDVQLAAAAGELALERIEAVGELRHTDNSCPGLRVVAGPLVRVVLRNSRFEGATGLSPYAAGGEVGDLGSDGAIVVAAGPFVAEACRFVGGQGGPASWAGLGPYPQARDGGAALRLTATIGVLEWCELIEGAPGFAQAHPFGPPPPVNPCSMYGAPGASTLTTEVYDCTRTFTPSGCGQVPQTLALNPGRADVQPIPPAVVGVPFPITIRPIANGLTFWVFGSGLGSVALPGIGGRLYADHAFLAGVVPPPGPSGWSTITFPAPPAALPFLPTFAVQPLHLDNAGTLQFGAVATFAVLVP